METNIPGTDLEDLQVPYVGTEEDRPAHSGKAPAKPCWCDATGRCGMHGTEDASISGDGKNPVDPRR